MIERFGVKSYQTRVVIRRRVFCGFLKHVWRGPLNPQHHGFKSLAQGEGDRYC